MVRMVLLGVMVLGLVACEGPVGPEGPAGPAGPAGVQGPPGPVTQALILEVPIEYQDGRDGKVIVLEDYRVSPESFRGIYLQIRTESGSLWFPFDYLLTAQASGGGPEVIAVLLTLGGLLIIDPEQSLLELALDVQRNSGGSGDVVLAVLVEVAGEE